MCTSIHPAGGDQRDQRRLTRGHQNRREEPTTPCTALPSRQEPLVTLRSLPRAAGRPPRIRFIPACAGNAAAAVRRATSTPVHPRVCGERPLGRLQGRQGQRFIPACAGNANAGGSGPHTRPVHPRVCGERNRQPSATGRGAGSSPRVRGTQPLGWPTATAARFIPACAGNAGWWVGDQTSRAVHPRVCGERPRGHDRACADAGSSPRVRGTRVPASLPVRAERFIPACAGNAPRAASATPCRPVHPRVCGERPIRETPARPSARFIPACAGNARSSPNRCRSNSVHPRVCGERWSAALHIEAAFGSSPRVRGTPACRCPSPRCFRFIPACAGNAEPTALCASISAVHPRVCGERVQVSESPDSRSGSSPRVRGTRQELHGVQLLERFIPACAGNAARRRWSPAPAPVHPRVCGERLTSVQNSLLTTGSSPRVRGTRRDEDRVDGLDRFIPACAGNARFSVTLRLLPAVHPRVCGERKRDNLLLSEKIGSSPRVRGTRGREVGGPHPVRFIPACAGNALHSGPLGRLAHGSSPRVRGTPAPSSSAMRFTRFIPACAGNACLASSRATMSTGSSPRVRGTPGELSFSVEGQSGSSPRVRGTRVVRGSGVVALRFIPACAGNASRARFGRRRAPVHPRVCGERDPAPPCTSCLPGSSPRVRGTLAAAAGTGARNRFIPACAGNASGMSPSIRRMPVHPRVCGERRESRVW